MSFKATNLLKSILSKAEILIYSDFLLNIKDLFVNQILPDDYTSYFKLVIQALD